MRRPGREKTVATLFRTKQPAAAVADRGDERVERRRHAVERGERDLELEEARREVRAGRRRPAARGADDAAAQPACGGLYGCAEGLGAPSVAVEAHDTAAELSLFSSF